MMPNTGPYQTGDPSLLRQLNLTVVMRCLRDCAPVYRAQLAEITGLNKTTVSSLVSDLIAQEYVLEIEPGAVTRASTKTGRPAVMLELNPNAGCAVAAEVGVNYLSVAVANFTGDVIWRQTERTRHLQGQHAINDRLLALLHLAVQHGRAVTKRLLGIAVGVPALMALETGAVLFAPNLRWENVPLGSMLREAFPCPIYVDNEANLAALAEAQYGAAKGYRDVLYISAGVGLGGGIIRDGQLYRGASGFAGEFGHMQVSACGDGLMVGEPGIGERRCGCGNYGCWETLVSERALFADIHSRIAEGQESLLAWAASEGALPEGKALPGGKVLPEGKQVSEAGYPPDDKQMQIAEGEAPAFGRPRTSLTVPMVVDAASAGDRVAIEALRTVGKALGSGMASLVNALNPELVVLGGSLSLAGEFLLPVIEVELEGHALRWSHSAARVVIAQHRFDACVMGGIATVIEASQVAPSHQGQVIGLAFGGPPAVGATGWDKAHRTERSLRGGDSRT